MNRIERWYWLQVAAWSLVVGMKEPAMRCYERVLAADPDDAKVIAAVGFRLAQAGRWREALARFDRVAALEPSDPEAHFNRGFLLQSLNDHASAVDAFDRTLALVPGHDRALYGKGLSLIALRRLDEAVPVLEKNTKLQPMSPYGWYQLGRVQFDRGKPEKTQTIIDHLGKFEPKIAAQLARETGLTAPPQP
ncbi:MAG: tetratricopeptide repeat protein [Burkholderiales bacterium]|nr:tetratricopeptide repeat protein [Burkholderiales bacterium]MCC7115879.1 tetratricopeptide repeat protein [Burkholderiales bacterium]